MATGGVILGHKINLVCGRGKAGRDASGNIEAVDNIIRFI